MIRAVIVFCLIFGAGCSRAPSRAPDTDAVVDEANREDVDGRAILSADREKAQEYLTALAKVASVAEETKLVAEFGEWLKKKDYKIRAEVKDGQHVLSCPYFPPVTPWTEHSFLSVKNLELLPTLDNGR